MPKRVEYVPPSPDLLEHFTRDAYREWGAMPVERDRVLDFAHFMEAVSNALAKDLTRKANSEFDNGIE